MRAIGWWALGMQSGHLFVAFVSIVVWIEGMYVMPKSSASVDCLCIWCLQSFWAHYDEAMEKPNQHNTHASKSGRPGFSFIAIQGSRQKHEIARILRNFHEQNIYMWCLRDNCLVHNIRTSVGRSRRQCRAPSLFYIWAVRSSQRACIWCRKFSRISVAMMRLNGMRCACISYDQMLRLLLLLLVYECSDITQQRCDVSFFVVVVENHDRKADEGKPFLHTTQRTYEYVAVAGHSSKDNNNKKKTNIFLDGNDHSIYVHITLPCFSWPVWNRDTAHRTQNGLL